jgi:hypothetical protein
MKTGTETRKAAARKAAQRCLAWLSHCLRNNGEAGGSTCWEATEVEDGNKVGLNKKLFLNNLYLSLLVFYYIKYSPAQIPTRSPSLGG